MLDNGELFARARTLHQNGRLGQAEEVYRELAQRDPGNDEVKLHLADLWCAQARFADALALCQELIRLKPNNANAHYRLGAALAGLGRRADALTEYRETLRLSPEHSEAHTSLGVALADQGLLDEAIPHLREAVRLQSHVAPAHLNLGIALAQLEQREEALKSLREAIRLQPDYAEAHGTLGNVLMQLKKREEAAAAYKEALRLKPDHVETYNNLGLALRELNRLDEAAIILRQAVRLRPTAPEGHNNLALILSHMGSYAEAESSYHEALRLRPNYVEAHINLGSNYKEQARTHEALTCYEIALWYDPDSATGHWNRSLSWLQMADFEKGWPEYEWRWKRPETPPRFFRQPRWDGSNLAGRTILLYTEQGLGDTIQFVRYAALLKRQGATVFLECPGFLVPLLSRCPGIDRLFAENSPTPTFDVHAPLMSLPGLVDTIRNIPAEIPYAFADPGMTAEWSRRLGWIDDFKVGIVWQGNPHHGWDRYRSVTLRQFSPLAQIEGVRLFSLQKGPGSEQLPAMDWECEVCQIVDSELMVPTGAFTDTAAAMMNLDLVVTVDTAPAHLAGALGVPVWVVLATLVDWRWLLGREDTPWYPTMRLFRQTKLGDWLPVFERMASEIRKIVTNKSRTTRTRPRPNIGSECGIPLTVTAGAGAYG